MFFDVYVPKEMAPRTLSKIFLVCKAGKELHTYQKERERIHKRYASHRHATNKRGAGKSPPLLTMGVILNVFISLYYIQRPGGQGDTTVENREGGRLSTRTKFKFPSPKHGEVIEVPFSYTQVLP